LDRSIAIRLKRRADEKLERFRARTITAEGNALGERVAAWAKGVFERAKYVVPAMPDTIKDREADKWEALFIVARLADVTDGTDATSVTAKIGYWETKARNAALAFQAEDRDTEPTSNGELLLRDIECILASYRFGSKEAIRTEILLDRLHSISESPWLSYFHGKPLDARGLARLLRPHGIRPTTIRFDKDTEAKGYYKADFADAWKRYLPTHTATAVTTVYDVTGVTRQDRHIGW
jgi:hypothetical protein